MKINFAQATHEDIDTFGDEGLFGPDNSGNFYYNFVEFGTNPGGIDEVAIHDGCGRYMPISVNNIPDLIAALVECYKVACEVQEANNTIDFVNSDEEGYVDSTKIKYEFEPV